MGPTVQGIGKGGRRYPGVGENICGGGPGSSTTWVGDVDNGTANWESFGWVTPQCGPQDEITTTSERVGW